MLAWVIDSEASFPPRLNEVSSCAAEHHAQALENLHPAGTNSGTKSSSWDVAARLNKVAFFYVESSFYKSRLNNEIS